MRLATTIITAGLLANVTNAYAERCKVEFVRAPDDVRLVIEQWLKAEPRCTGSIELRVVPTDRGTFYLVAQRPDGRIHEREVPDAQSAGVLVASWVADDWTSDRDEEPVTAPVRAAPGDVPSEVVAVPPPAAAPAGPGKWITLGLLLGPDPERNGGFHLDVDLFQRGAWTFGVTGEYAETASPGDPFSDSPWMHTSDWRVLLKLARTFRIGPRTTIGAVVGVGLTHTETTVTDAMTFSGPEYLYQDVPQESAIAEAGLTISREIFANWALQAGPKATFTEGQIHYLYDGLTLARDPVTLAVLFGARYRL